ncbi:hypothetical protein ACBJ59_36280 [Nonomuraea sp. MTCD27]|uniref:hypothetical protein n=1 Tax=Nonomuraea sp. MTCD27 TaxID=1676747 RepID=UPI0035BFDB79
MMAQPRDWLSLAEASSVLDIPEFQVLELAVAGRLHSRIRNAGRELRALDVDEFASECAGQMAGVAAEHVDKPAWTPWSAAQDPDAFADRAHDDTPDDEGEIDA